MRLSPEEPEATGFEALDDAALVSRLAALLPNGAGQRLVLVDGRSGAGKSTFSERLAALLNGQVAHTDDVAWNHDAMDWEAPLLEGVIEPWRHGEAVSYRPPGWVTHDRAGTIEIPACAVLVVEGVGAGRASLAPRADLVVWVQSDQTEARRRGVARDVEQGPRSPAEAEAFWEEWMLAEEPFLAADRPWTRAALVVNGTPPDRDRVWVATGPLRG